MARRKRIPGDPFNLDSLMDALTNVVAVLILVLILVQTEVTQKVTEFLENLEPATPEQVVESQEALEELEEKRQLRVELLKEDPTTPAQLEEEKRKLALLEKNVTLDESLLVDLEELRKLEREVRRKRDSELAESNALQEEIARLEAQIDTTPVLKAPLPTAVTIPNSRSIPANARIYHAMVRVNRVHFIDVHTPAETFYDEVKRNRRELFMERIRVKGADRQIYNHQKTLDHFKGFDFQNPYGQKVAIISNPTQPHLILEITPEPTKSGTALEGLDAPDNQFKDILRELRRDRRNVLLFLVSPDSFNTYLVARALADKAGIPAGWEVDGRTSFRHVLRELEVNRLEEPKPRGPDDPPRPPQPPKIGPKLD